MVCHSGHQEAVNLGSPCFLGANRGNGGYQATTRRKNARKGTSMRMLRALWRPPDFGCSWWWQPSAGISVRPAGIERGRVGIMEAEANRAGGGSSGGLVMDWTDHPPYAEMTIDPHPFSIVSIRTTVGQNPRGLRGNRKLPCNPSTTDQTDGTDRPICIRVVRAIRGQEPRLIWLRRQPRWVHSWFD